ncbi:restriction endonuclease [Amycolatopsis sp. WAC 01375]|uniref:restriction endonuclease n=1 Tax=Amycolatopsis sp. WAC 01375 TaxID=2203194 RepID=UPI001315A99B|nr:restriction endonuclease [Amycolatopsis sp. WAC 01375]
MRLLVLFNTYEISNREDGLMLPKEVGKHTNGQALFVPGEGPVAATIFHGAARDGYLRLLYGLAGLPRTVHGRSWGWAMSQIGFAADITITPGELIRFHEDDFWYDEMVSERLALLCVGNCIRIVDRQDWRSIVHEPKSYVAGSLLESLSVLTPYNWVLDEAASDEIDRAFQVNDLRGDSSSDARRFEEDVAAAIDSFDVGLVELTQFSADGGMDAVLYLRDGSKLRVVYVQFKSGQRRATVKEVRELIGVVARDGASTGLLVSASGFTKDAKREASISRVKVSLTTAQELAKLFEANLFD